MISPFAAAEDPRTDALARSISASIELSLRLATAQTVETAGWIFPNRSLERAQAYYRKVGADRAVYGRVEPSEEGGFSVIAQLWSVDEPGVAQLREYRIESVLESFDIADRIAVEIASEVVGRDLAFGTLRVRNTDPLNEFAVYVDANLVARNQNSVRILSGRRNVVIARPGDLGDEPIESFTVDVPENDVAEVTLTAPRAAEGVADVDQAGEPAEGTGEESALSGSNTIEDGDAGRDGTATSDEGDVGPVTGVSPGQKRTGSLRVGTEPAGAEVLLDGTVIGTTPLERFGVPEGRYELVVRRRLFREVTRVVDVSFDRNAEVELILEVDPEDPEVARVLVNPASTSIAGLGMTLLQLGGLAGTPLTYSNYFLMLGLDTVVKSGLFRPAHRMGARPAEQRIVTGAGLLFSGVFATAMVFDPYFGIVSGSGEGQSQWLNRLSEIGASAGIGGLGATISYDLAFGPAATRRRNAAVLSDIKETGALPAQNRREPEGLSFETGGNAVARVGYAVPIIAHFLYAHASLGGALTGADPLRVGPSVLVRLEGYPLGASTGNLRSYIGPVLVAETDFGKLGASAGYDFGVARLANFGNIFLGSRTVYGFATTTWRSSFYLGVQL